MSRQSTSIQSLLSSLEPFTMDAKLLSMSLSTKIDTETKRKDRHEKDRHEKGQDTKKVDDKKEELSIVERFFIPKEKDTLFWCYYVIQHGASKYEFPGATSFVNEKAEKFKCIDLLRLHKQELKTKKIKHLKENIEDELANKETIGNKTFIALCIVNNINILFIHKRKCYELLFDEQSTIHVIHCMDNDDLSSRNYRYEWNCPKEQIELYRSTLFKWEDIDKPLRAISYYTLDSLKTIYQRFHPENQVKKTKKDMYEYLIMNL